MPCFLCKQGSVETHGLISIGTNGLMICPDCLKNIAINKVSAFSITSKYIKICKRKAKTFFADLSKEGPIKVYITIPKAHTFTIEQAAKYCAERL